MIEGNKANLISTTFNPIQMTFFPMGSIHTMVNPIMPLASTFMNFSDCASADMFTDCDVAQPVSTLNSPDAGDSCLANALNWLSPVLVSVASAECWISVTC